jgi:phosphatidylserine decarboxylase
MSAITRFLPRRALSRWVGYLVTRSLPQPLNTWVIRAFAKHYRIKLEDAEKPVSEYANLGDFFVRGLKPGLRPLGSTWAVHPSDSVISVAQSITAQLQFVQAKGLDYPISHILPEPEAVKNLIGGFSITYYLCPTDYHRVHSPVTGVIRKVWHLAGDLWPVNSWSLANVRTLFGVNERVVLDIETDRGMVHVVFVGATNVGQISLRCLPSLRTNLSGLETVRRDFSLGTPVQKGEELGCFHMGSTVVVFYPAQAQGPSQISTWLGKQVVVRGDFF